MPNSDIREAVLAHSNEFMVCEKENDFDCESDCDGVMVQIDKQSGRSLMVSTIPYFARRLDCDGKIHGGGNEMSWKQAAEELQWLFWNETCAHGDSRGEKLVLFDLFVSDVFAVF